MLGGWMDLHRYEVGRLQVVDRGGDGEERVVG